MQLVCAIAKLWTGRANLGSPQPTNMHEFAVSEDNMGYDSVPLAPGRDRVCSSPSLQLSAQLPALNEKLGTASQSLAG